MASVIIKILSGVHLGAEIELIEGTWVFGRDDHCDIILSDSSIASRHVSIVVQTEGALGVSCQALDGQVLAPADEEPVAGNLVPGSVYKIGNVYFAWGAKDATAQFWANVARNVTALSSPQAGVAAVDARQEGDVTDQGPNASAESAAANTVEAIRASSQERKGNRLTTACLLLMLLGAGVYWCMTQLPEDVMTPQQTQAPRRVVDVKALAQRVKADGYADIRVTEQADGTVAMNGSVANDADRGRLVALARGLNCPVLINVSVDSDYTTALQSAFNTIDFWPSVTLKKNPKGDVLVVSGYMLSSVVEERAFAEAQRNVPGLSAGTSDRVLTVRRDVRYRDTMQKIFVTAFRANKIGPEVKVEYLPGRVRFIATLTPALRDKLDKALKQIHAKSPVPVAIEVVNLGSYQAASVTATPTLEEPQSRHERQDSFRVVGVSGGALKFVTLSSGEKVFVGGRLPGGFILESIEYNQLILSKNNQRIVYPLKVSK
jgi:type III secretion protein D